MSTQPPGQDPPPIPKLLFDAKKPDGTVTKLELSSEDVLSAAVVIVGPGKAIEMQVQGVPKYRITVIELGAEKKRPALILPRGRG